MHRHAHDWQQKYHGQSYDNASYQPKLECATVFKQKTNLAAWILCAGVHTWLLKQLPTAIQLLWVSSPVVFSNESLEYADEINGKEHNFFKQFQDTPFCQMKFINIKIALDTAG